MKNPNNYDVWKFRTEMYLEKEDLYNVNINDPSDSMLVDFRNKNKKACAVIYLLIEEFRKRVRVLLPIKDVHEKSNLSIKLFLPRKLYSIKLYEGGKMTNHVTKVYRTRDKRSTIGENINDKYLAVSSLSMSQL